MADEVEVEIVEDEITVSVEGTSTWDTLTGKPTATAENDFIVADAALAWVKKTLAQVKTILGLGTAAFQNIAYFALASHTHVETDITSDPFQTPVFANPLNLDATDHKDFKCGIITGDTTINLNNSSDGDSGMIELIIDGVGGYNVSLGDMFTKSLGGSIDTTASADNFISWRMVKTDIVYVIDQVE